MDYINYYESPLGRIMMASDGATLTGLWFEDQKFFAQGLSQEYKETDLPIFQHTVEWLNIYFNGKNPDFTLPISIRTTSFRSRVYEILLAIPYGQTMTYGEIANLIAKSSESKSMSAQAVGGAVGHNPISIIIPCHRVIGSDGRLIGYAGGIDKKAKLLELEKSH